MGRSTAAVMGIVIWLGGSFLSPLMANDSKPVPTEFELAPNTLARSTSPVWSLAVSPEGTLTASGNESGQIILRNPITQETARVLGGHRGVVSALDFTPSGEYLASAGVDGQIRLWHVASGRLQFTLTGHTNWITGLKFSPNGETLASCGYDKTVRLWNPKTGIKSAQFDGHTATVRNLVFSPDGDILASAGDAGIVWFWNLKTNKHHQPFPPHTAGWQAVDFSPDGQKLLTVPQDGKIQIWDLKTKKAEKSFSAVAPNETDTTPQTARFASKGLTVLVGTRGGRARVWSVKTGKLLQSLDGHEDIVSSLALPRDGKTLYTGSLDGKIQAWPAMLPLESPLHKLPLDAGKVWAIALSPDGNTLATGGKGGFVELWDLTTGKRQRLLEGFDSTVDCLRFSADGTFLAAAGWRSEKLISWNVESGEILHDLTLKEKLRCFAISPDAKTLVVGFAKSKTVSAYSLPEGKETWVAEDHDLPVYDLAFSPNGDQLATCSGEWTERKPGRVVIYDPAMGGKLAQFDDHTHAVRSLAFSPDGSQLGSLSQDGVLKLYNMRGLRESLTLRNGLDARPLACSSDGKFVAVGLQNGNINVWDLKREKIIRRLQGVDDVFAVAFSRDGSLLLAADGNEFVQMWKLSERENSLAQTVLSWKFQSSPPASAEKNPQETP